VKAYAGYISQGTCANASTPVPCEHPLSNRIRPRQRRFAGDCPALFSRLDSSGIVSRALTTFCTAQPLYRHAGKYLEIDNRYAALS
jgi:hypothetical protein